MFEVGKRYLKLKRKKLVGIIKVLIVTPHPSFNNFVIVSYCYEEMSDFIECIGNKYEKIFNIDGTSLDEVDGITHKPL